MKLAALLLVASMLINLVSGPLRAEFSVTEQGRWLLWAASSLCLILMSIRIWFVRKVKLVTQMEDCA